jgi:hypothetical protein
MERCRWVALPPVLLMMSGCAGDAALVADIEQNLAADCSSADGASGFVSRGFEGQSGIFSAHFDATPASAPSDALAGLTLGEADGYKDLAAIVRFNANGLVDARNGGRYEAASPIPYSAGVTQKISMRVDMITRTYSAWVDDQLLANDFSFRNEQSGTFTLDTLALKVDEGAGVAVCNVRVVTHSVCQSAAAGEGFVNTSLPPMSPAFTVRFIGVPRAANMDGVMGVSAAAASSFPALAAAVRFSPSGVIDALDGSDYTPLGGGYAPHQRHAFVLTADAVDNTYSVVADAGVTRNLKFRPQQSSASSLGNFAQVSDSTTGALTVCDLRGGGARGVEWIHDGGRYGDAPRSLAVSQDRLLLSDASRTLVLDAEGAVRRELAYGGKSVSDALGNFYLFGKFDGSYDGGTGPVYPTAGGGNVYISKYDSDFNPIYTRALGTTPDVQISSPAANAQGDIAFVLSGGGTSTAVKLDPSGETRWSSDYPVTAIDLDPSGNMLIGLHHANSFTVSKLDRFGSVIWSQTGPTRGVAVQGVSFDSLGNAVFWGSIEAEGELELGGTTFVAPPTEQGSLGLLGSLTPGGSPRFFRTTTMNHIQRVLAGEAGALIVVGTNNHWLEGRLWQLDRYDETGNLSGTRNAAQLLPSLDAGSSGDAALDSAGHVYWQFFPQAVDHRLNYLAKLLP